MGVCEIFTWKLQCILITPWPASRFRHSCVSRTSGMKHALWKIPKHLLFIHAFILFKSQSLNAPFAEELAYIESHIWLMIGHSWALSWVQLLYRQAMHHSNIKCYCVSGKMTSLQGHVMWLCQSVSNELRGRWNASELRQSAGTTIHCH